MTDGTIEQRFLRFHGAHPEVYAEMVRLTRRLVQAGHRRVGVKMIWEVMRWRRMWRGLPDPLEDYKLCNDYHSRYARLIMAQEPDLVGIFRTRRLEAP
jgi:hypothetical protein